MDIPDVTLCRFCTCRECVHGCTAWRMIYKGMSCYTSVQSLITCNFDSTWFITTQLHIHTCVCYALSHNVIPTMFCAFSTRWYHKHEWQHGHSSIKLGGKWNHETCPYLSSCRTIWLDNSIGMRSSDSMFYPSFEVRRVSWHCSKITSVLTLHMLLWTFINHRNDVVWRRSRPGSIP